MKQILLIGGGGYIGTILAEYLLNKGFKVKVLDLFLYKNESFISQFTTNKNFAFVKGDFCDAKILNHSLKNVSSVVVLAGLVGDPITKKYPFEAKQINEKGILNCIDLLNNKGLDRVILVSTCSNYGIVKKSELANENEQLNPLSDYAKAKVLAEKHLLNCKDKVDYIPTILRFATAFGKSFRMRFDLTINEFCRELAVGNKLVVYDQNTWRPYCHVKDFARLIHIALLAPKEKVDFEIFNAGGDQNNCTKEKIIEYLKNFFPESNVLFNQKTVDARDYRVSFKKVKDVLNFEPEHDIVAGIKEIIELINNNDGFKIPKLPNKFGNYEINYKS